LTPNELRTEAFLICDETLSAPCASGKPEDSSVFDGIFRLYAKNIGVPHRSVLPACGIIAN
jgi:hypothetical protein